MTPDELDAVLRAVNGLRPFRAYAIEFLSGSLLEVRHPEAIIRQGRFHVHTGPDRARRVLAAGSVATVLIPPGTK